MADRDPVFIAINSWSLPEVIRQVNECIECGYVPCGGLIYANGEYLIALVKFNLTGCSC